MKRAARATLAVLPIKYIKVSPMNRIFRLTRDRETYFARVSFSDSDGDGGRDYPRRLRAEV